MSIKKFYIGAICNRDVEIFHKIVDFAKQNHNIKIVNLLKKGKFKTKYFKKKIKKYPFSLLIIKLYSEESNEEIYQAVAKYAPHIPRLNSVLAVKTCESRRATYHLVDKKCKKTNYPKPYYSVRDALKAILKGKKLIVKRDVHSSRHIKKEDRIVGIAKKPCDLLDFIKGRNINELFFQEYLGKFDVVYKAYIIDRWIVSITSHDRLKKYDLTPLELVHIRVPIDKELKRRILKIGRKFGMSVYGVDYVMLEDGTPYIVDINDFPSFRNIPEAISLISDHLYEIVNARQNLEKLPYYFKSKSYMT
ncbi:MAG: hypothetical protein GF353_27145 [Candidatus Lokiarchaeota archaeon]|nr:hypothetical protein [Candidatus Lokiarchaeota archaeon]